MFAFALHDQREHRLMLARDRLGIKPLYYTRTAEGLLFSSELKGLLTLMPNVPVVRDEAIADYLQNQFNSGRETVFADIQRVLPGEYLMVDTQTLEISHHTYWTVLDVAAARQQSHLTMTDAAQDFEQLFEQVMTEHMRSDVPYGLFLSGGIVQKPIVDFFD